MAKALHSGQVDTYILEAEDVVSGPLAACPNAILLKPFGWFTREAIQRNKEIWYVNLKSMLEGKPQNIVSE